MKLSVWKWMFAGIVAGSVVSGEMDDESALAFVPPAFGVFVGFCHWYFQPEKGKQSRFDSSKLLNGQ